MKPKYLLKPGFIISKNDGERHWISSTTLINLYRVNPRECIISSTLNDDPEDLIILRPQYNGNYTLTE